MDALTEMTSHNRTYGYYNLTVMTYGDTAEEAETTLRIKINQVLQRRGYLTVRETLHLQSAVWSIPGQWGELVRWHFVSSGNMADLAPVRPWGSVKRRTITSRTSGDGVGSAGADLVRHGVQYPLFLQFSSGGFGPCPGNWTVPNREVIVHEFPDQPVPEVFALSDRDFRQGL